MGIDPLTTGGAIGGGGILGAILTFFGIKSKIDSVDKRVDNLTNVVQFASTCGATHKGVENQFKNLNEKIDNNHADVKDRLDTILGKLP